MIQPNNAQLAVAMYDELANRYQWTAETAWKGIARLLLTCDIWKGRWEPFHNVVVHRETNDYEIGPRGPNACLQRASELSDYLAAQLNVPREILCSNVGLYWKHPQVSHLQPHNPVGHAFRSIVVRVLRKYGNDEIAYGQEVNPAQEFPGQEFRTRSKNPRIDIVARRGNRTVALISTRWRYRHDRVDVVEEAMAYAPAARRHNPSCQLYAVVGEFSPARLEKILTNCPPVHANPALSAAVHFAPQLIREGLKENGRLAHLKSLEWLIAETHRW